MPLEKNHEQLFRFSVKLLFGKAYCSVYKDLGCTRGYHKATDAQIHLMVSAYETILQ